jgi:hypothetical protein
MIKMNEKQNSTDLVFPPSEGVDDEITVTLPLFEVKFDVELGREREEFPVEVDVYVFDD